MHRGSPSRRAATTITCPRAVADLLHRDYVHGSDEETILTQTKAVSAAEARARFHREEADAVCQVREYEAARREARVRRVKLKIVELDADDA